MIRGGEYLEEIGRLRAIAFDKTGTLTRGQPDVVEVVCASGQDDESRVLRIAAALGDRGGHVLGKAIARHARGLRLDVPVADNYTAIPGLGALGQVDAVEYHLGSHRYIDEAGLCRPEFHTQLGQAENTAGTAVALTASSGPLGWIRLADRPRPEAARRAGRAAQARPSDHHAHRRQRADGRRHGPRAGRRRRARGPAAGRQGHRRSPSSTPATARPAWSATASTTPPPWPPPRSASRSGGISSGAALESADIVLLADDLSRLPWLIRNSRATLARIRQNIAIALLTKLVVLVLAVFGLANLWMAIAADVGTSLVVIANALRLLRESE